AGERLAHTRRGAACAAGHATGEARRCKGHSAASGAGHDCAEWRARASQYPAEPTGRVIGMIRKAGDVPGGQVRPASFSRRAALLAPLALGGCGLWDDWFGTRKTPLPGKREPIVVGRRALSVDEGVPKVTLPPEVRNAAWPQAGGNPAHFMGHLAVGERLTEAWTANIGE